MVKPKIFAFSNVKGGGDGIAYAMAEDGTVLGSHWCSNETFVPMDLGVTDERPATHAKRHSIYSTHYPDGYEMEFVRAADVAAHEGLGAAWELNQERARLAAEQEPTSAAGKARSPVS